MATELKRSDAMDRIAELLGADASKLLDHKILKATMGA